MAKIKRYNCGNGEGMFEESKGHWVEWSEYQKLNRELQRLLQQTPCSTLREEVEQKLSSAYAARDFATIAQNEAKHMKASERIKTLEEVLKLISDISPVA